MLDRISTKIFADGADLDGILRLAADPRIKGFTTNPTLMWKAGLTDYAEFAQRLLEQITDKPISFEVFADDAEEIAPPGARDRRRGATNVYVKIPVTTTARRVAGAARARAVRGRRPGQRDRAVHAARRSSVITARGRATARRAASRCSPGASPTPGVDPLPIMSGRSRS